MSNGGTLRMESSSILAEVQVDTEVNRDEIPSLLQTLESRVNAKILRVSSHFPRTSVFCSLDDPQAFLLTIPRLSRVLSWRLVYPQDGQSLS